MAGAETLTVEVFGEVAGVLLQALNRLTVEGVLATNPKAPVARKAAPVAGPGKVMVCSGWVVEYRYRVLPLSR
jgi:hypothetical protein